MWARMLRRQTLVHCWWNMKGTAPVENSLVAPHKNKQNYVGACVAF